MTLKYEIHPIDMTDCAVALRFRFDMDRSGLGTFELGGKARDIPTMKALAENVFGRTRLGDFRFTAANKGWFSWKGHMKEIEEALPRLEECRFIFQQVKSFGTLTR